MVIYPKIHIHGDVSMKKMTALICILLSLSLCACGRVEFTGEPMTHSAAASTEPTTAEKPVVVDGATLKNRPEIWAAKYPDMAAELNEFFIVSGETTSFYYYRTGSDLEAWLNSELNIDKWYYYGGRVISNDGKWALPLRYEALSPMVTYAAEPYEGQTVDAQQRVPSSGTVYALNSATPFTLTGLRLDGGISQEGNGRQLALKGIRDSFQIGEPIRFYIDGSNAREGEENLLANKLMIYCLPHRDSKDYLIMSADNIASSAAFSDKYKEAAYGGFNFENSVMNDESGSFPAGAYDIVFCYENTPAYYIIINIT